MDFLFKDDVTVLFLLGISFMSTFIRTGDDNRRRLSKPSVCSCGGEWTTIYTVPDLKGLSHEIDFKNVVENGQILALIRAAAGFLIFRRLL